MKRLRLITLLGLGILLLGACSTQPGSVTPPAETIASVTKTVAIPTQPVAMEPVEDNCVTCHTDKEMLINTSAPVEENQESESEGVG